MIDQVIGVRTYPSPFSRRLLYRAVPTLGHPETARDSVRPSVWCGSSPGLTQFLHVFSTHMTSQEAIFLLTLPQHLHPSEPNAGALPMIPLSLLLGSKVHSIDVMLRIHVLARWLYVFTYSFV